jgi:hypothetical protein
MNLLASGRGGDIEPVPGSSTHTRFHRNEEDALVGQRVLAEVVCREYAECRDTTAPAVRAAMYAYRDWCQRHVAAEAEELEHGGYRARSTGPTPDQAEWGVVGPVSDVCGLLDPERERIRRALPVLSCIWHSWAADRPSEWREDNESANAAVDAWLTRGEA